MPPYTFPTVHSIIISDHCILLIAISLYINITNGAELLDRSGYANYKGGAIISVQSIVIFTGLTILTSNRGRLGGAIEATESTITLYGETVIDNNTEAGIHLHHSNLEILPATVLWWVEEFTVEVQSSLYINMVYFSSSTIVPNMEVDYTWK